MKFQGGIKMSLQQNDSTIFGAIDNERNRQLQTLELIASENFVSEDVLEAMGSVMTNKYAEGYPGKRYYGGCEFVDVAEVTAIERLTKLFGAKYANVQPHSGANANLAVFFALLQPGDKIMGMNLSHGGHLTPGIQGGPLMHIIAAKAVAFHEALQPSFKEYVQQIIHNSKALGNALMKEGASLVSGGTDNHIILLDLRPWDLTGKEAEKLLEEAGITVNKNTIPFDPQSPFVTSGIRIGTAALTTRGMREEEMIKIGEVMAAVLKSNGDKDVLNKAKETTKSICEAFPIFAQPIHV